MPQNNNSKEGEKQTGLTAELLVIQCGGADVLRDDAFAYAEALQAAGVDVEVHGYAGLPHCFPAVIPTVDQTEVFYERYNRFLRRHAGGEGSR